MEELTIAYGEVALGLSISIAPCGLVGFEREARGQSVRVQDAHSPGSGLHLPVSKGPGRPGFRHANEEAEAFVPA